ncbi:MAG TPA: outer membrane beta-barrel protein [Puia sp.]|nr:outer membrane beta-barrel protein [Puia sp.]
MMERNFYSDEFEQLIREKTEQYKMYPSEKVWKGVYSSLHTKKRWYIAGMSLLITGIIFLAGRELISPSSHAGASRKSIIASTTPAVKTSTENTLKPRPFPELRRTPHSSFSDNPDNHSSQSPGQPADDRQRLTAVTLIDPEIGQPDPSSAIAQPSNQQIPAGLAGKEPIRQDPVLVAGMNAGAVLGSNGMASVNAGSVENPIIEDGARNDGKDEINKDDAARAKAIASTSVKSRIANPASLARNGAVPADAIGAGLKETLANGGLDASSPAQKELAATQRINWLRDFAVYNLPPSPKRNRTYLQLYFSPTVNYRSLAGGDYSGSKTFVSGVPVSLLHMGGAKDYVNHNPALGFELGGSFLYRVTRNLTLKAGLQFSYSRYTIKAYAASPERATIALGTTLYGYIMDSISNYSSIRNFGGRKQVTLNNEYFQLAAPVGFELRIMGNERLQLNIAATVQPTFLMNTNSYLLTTDYTSYTSQPSLFRRLNVNAGLEAFLSYRTGGIRWQIGPEFRYQLLSTYSNQYPIRENLKGYGIKIGISKAIR